MNHWKFVSDEKTLKKILLVLLLVFLAVFSIFVCANKATELGFFSNSVEKLDETKDTVMKFSGATLAVSVGITLLPDDYATPLAEELAELSEYVILILGMLFLEKMIVLEGVPMVFAYVIPCACLFYGLYVLTKKETFKSFGTKLVALSLAVVLVVPCGTALSNRLGAGYMGYVQDTFSTAETGADQVDEISSTGNADASFFDKVSNVFQTAISGVKELFDYFSNLVKKCIHSIAILVVTSLVIPVLTFVFLLWLINQLFQFNSFYSVSNKSVGAMLKKLSVSKEEKE